MAERRVEARFRPLGTMIVLREIETKDKVGSLYIPDTGKDKPVTGVVVAIGPGTEDEDMYLKIGEEVAFSKYSGHAITIDEIEFIAMKQGDILFVIDP